VDAAAARYRWSHLSGEPDALKGVCPVWEEVVGNGSSQLLYDNGNDTALAAYFIRVSSLREC